jgi:hypothetical protein
VKDNQLGPEGGKAVAEALKVNSSIQHLDLACNDFQIFFFYFPFLNTNSPKKQKGINLDQKKARQLQKH